jgi:8-oxo-dGTP pyrophosphatase MutT (NUDIX family)
MSQDIDSVSKVIICWRGKLLMLERINGDGWELPGGHLNLGEKFLQGAIREVYEETKIKLKRLKVIHREKKFRLFIAQPKTIKVTISDEHLNYKWVNRRDILKLKLSRATKLNLKSILNSI